MSGLTEQEVSDLKAWQRRTLLRRLLAIAIITLLGGIAGHIHSEIFYPVGAEGRALPWRGFRQGASIAFVASAIEMLYMRRRDTWLRKAAFLPGVIMRIVVITIVIRLLLAVNDIYSNWLLGAPLSQGVADISEGRDTLISLVLVVFAVATAQLSSIIGVKRFANLVTGRYFRPIEEERIFLIVDVVGSSAIARKLGDTGFHQYLSEIFYLLDQAIVQNGGEVVSYVGDAVIVTWPLSNDARRNGRALAAIKQMRLAALRTQTSFQKRFGMVPTFRAALHGGPVVVGECGDSRRQVTFLGDTVNMTARIEAAGKALDESFLASSSLIARMQLPSGVSADPMGTVDLKGAAEPMALHRITFNA